MTPGSLQTLWFPLLALLAVEAGLAAAIAEVLQFQTEEAQLADLIQAADRTLNEMERRNQEGAFKSAFEATQRGASSPPFSSGNPEALAKSAVEELALIRRAQTPGGRTGQVTAEEAASIGWYLANQEAERLYHCQLFVHGPPARLVGGRWKWEALRGRGRFDFHARVEFGKLGTNPTVEVECWMASSS